MLAHNLYENQLLSAENPTSSKNKLPLDFLKDLFDEKMVCFAAEPTPRHVASIELTIALPHINILFLLCSFELRGW